MAAEPTGVSIEATNIFGLGANFNTQTSSTRTVLDRQMVMDAVGNQQCETMINQRDEVSQPANYCGTDIATDLDTFLTQFGDVQNGYVVTQLVVNFLAGQYPNIEVTGHQHNANTHAAGLTLGYADVSAAMPASQGLGVPTLAGVTLGTNATCAGLTITFSMNHVDVLDSDGGHFVGKNLTPTADLTYSFNGVPTTAQPITNWTTDSYGTDDSNQEFDLYEVTAHRYFDLATA